MNLPRNLFRNAHTTPLWHRGQGVGVRSKELGVRETVTSPLVRRLALYGLASVICGTLTIWSTGQVQAINADTTSLITSSTTSTQQSLIDALKNSKTSAFTLAERGLALLKVKNRTADASLYLQAAALKDPNYRDAALYAGAAELTLADASWQSSPTIATAHTKTARQFLEMARAIDPIHAETFHLLEIAYTNLGQTQLAADAKQKASLFSTPGKNS